MFHLTVLEVQVKTHWVNGWFIRLFSRPVVVVDGKEYAASFTHPTVVDVEDGRVVIGGGIRYFARGVLLGFEPEERILEGEDAIGVVVRNGFWNHSPFRIVSWRGLESARGA